MPDWYEDDSSGSGGSSIDAPSRAGERGLVIGALILEVLAIVLIVVDDSVRMRLGGYLIGCLAPLMLVAFSRRLSERTAARFGVSASAGAQHFLIAVTLVALVIALASSFLIARTM